MTATSRFSFVSVARYTSPIPPTPIWAAISYGPRRVPGESAKPLNYKGGMTVPTGLVLINGVVFTDSGFQPPKHPLAQIGKHYATRED